MNRTFVVMVVCTLLLYSGTFILFDQVKCWPSTFNPVTRFPIYSMLLCNH